MINGVMSIVAAVLFAFVSVEKGFDVIWLSIAGIYLVTGILNLIVYAVKNKRSQKAARAAGAKEEKEKAEKAEKAKVEKENAERARLAAAQTGNQENTGGV